jgi:hypothetical protein
MIRVFMPKIYSDSGGDVIGPNSSTDEAIVRFNGTAGDEIQNSTATINDTGDVVFQTTTDSQSAFTIKDSAGNDIFVAETLPYNLAVTTPSAFRIEPFGFGPIPGSGSFIRGMRYRAEIGSGTQTNAFRGFDTLLRAAGSASATGTNSFRASNSSIAWNSTGTCVSMIGMQNFLACGGGVGTTTGLVTDAHANKALIGFNNNDAGSFTNGISFYAASPNNIDANHTITNMYAVRVEDQAGTGVTNSWGIKIDDQTAPGKAIVTGIGNVEFGDTTIIDTTHAEALLVRQASDAADVFTVNTQVAGLVPSNTNTVAVITGGGAQTGSSSLITGIDVNAEVDAGTHSGSLFGLDINSEVTGSAVKSGTFGNHQSACNFISRHNSTGTNEEIYGIVGQVILGAGGSGVNLGLITNAYGMRFGWEYQTSGTASATNTHGIYVNAPTGTAATRTVTNNYGLLIEDQAATDITNAFAIKTGTGDNEFGDTVKIKTVNEITFAGALQETSLLVVGDDSATGLGMANIMYSDTGGRAATLVGGKARGTDGSPTVVVNGDSLFNFAAVGYDGTDFAAAATITFQVDGVPGSGDMPGRIIFATSADGTEAPAAALTINSTQTSLFSGNATPLTDDLASLGILGTGWSDLFLASGGTINWGSGEILMETTANTISLSGGSWNQDGNGAVSASTYLSRYSADAFGNNYTFRKSRAAVIGNQVILQDNDSISNMRYYGSDGAAPSEGARISILVDGTPAAGDMPMEILFMTKPAGGALATRIGIASSGDITFGSGVAGYDQVLTFDGETNDGVLTWMEDEDYFKFGDDVNIDTLTASKFVGTDANKTLTSVDVNMVDLEETRKTANSMTVTTGTLSSGSVSDTQTWADGNTVNIAEVTGVPGFDVLFTFTSVTDFARIGLSAYYSGTHDVEVQIYDDTNTTWRVLWDFGSGTTFNYRYSDIPVSMATRQADYINGSNEVKIRFYHPSSGNASHDLYIDYVSIIC